MVHPLVLRHTRAVFAWVVLHRLSNLPECLVCCYYAMSGKSIDACHRRHHSDYNRTKLGMPRYSIRVHTAQHVEKVPGSTKHSIWHSEVMISIESSFGQASLHNRRDPLCQFVSCFGSQQLHKFKRHAIYIWYSRAHEQLFPQMLLCVSINNAQETTFTQKYTSRCRSYLRRMTNSLRAYKYNVKETKRADPQIRIFLQA